MSIVEWAMSRCYVWRRMLSSIISYAFLPLWVRTPLRFLACHICGHAASRVDLSVGPCPNTFCAGQRLFRPVLRPYVCPSVLIVEFIVGRAQTRVLFLWRDGTVQMQQGNDERRQLEVFLTAETEKTFHLIRVNRIRRILQISEQDFCYKIPNHSLPPPTNRVQGHRDGGKFKYRPQETTLTMLRYMLLYMCVVLFDCRVFISGKKGRTEMN